MNNEKLISDLAALPPVKWQSGRFHHSENGSDPVAWIPVATLIPVPGTPPLSLGLSSSGRWVVVAPGGSLFDCESEKNYWPLFPLLELTHAQVLQKLSAELTRHGLDLAWIGLFPFDHIVAAALMSGSKFWPDSALSWVPSLPLTAEIFAALNVLVRQGRTQQQRHTAKKLLAVTRQIDNSSA